MGSDLGDLGDRLEPRHVDSVVAPNLTLFLEKEKKNNTCPKKKS
jgi:hypothetical protein